MKILFGSFVILAGASFLLSGCASDPTTSTPATDPTRKRVYTQEELKKTGQSETGPALEKVDPAIQTSGR
jgi:outer membrane biogenesis lipoprotein LolB